MTLDIAIWNKSYLYNLNLADLIPKTFNLFYIILSMEKLIDKIFVFHFRTENLSN